MRKCRAAHPNRACPHKIPDAYLYFAYGSNMNPERIRQRIPEARPVWRATLRGWRLVERLYADVEKARGGRAEGKLSPSQEYPPKERSD